MSRSWPYLTAVAVVGVLAGAAIGGKPEAQDPFVLSPEQIPTTTILSVTTSVPSLATTTTIVAPRATTTTTTVAADATGATDTIDAATDTGSTAVAGSAEDSAATTRIVIADASGAPEALDTAQAALAAAGYTQIATSAVAVPEASTTIYYRAGFAAQADAVAGLLGAVQATLVPLIDQVVSTVDDQGDVVVLLGSDVAS